MSQSSSLLHLLYLTTSEQYSSGTSSLILVNPKTLPTKHQKPAKYQLLILPFVEVIVDRLLKLMKTSSRDIAISTVGHQLIFFAEV